MKCNIKKYLTNASLQRVLVFLVGALFSIWGSINVLGLINDMSIHKTSKDLENYLLFIDKYPPGIYIPFYFFWITTSFAIAFGCWTYKRWARILTLAVSSLSAFVISVKYVQMLMRHAELRRITREMGKRGAFIEFSDLWFEHPAQYLYCIIGFILIFAFMLPSRPENLLNREGVVDNANKTYPIIEFTCKLAIVILAAFILSFKFLVAN